MIEFRNVSKVYPGSSRPAVDDLSFEVLDGDICVLVGPSGCGKTTIMRMVNRLIEPTGGDILIDGEPNTAFGSTTPEETYEEARSRYAERDPAATMLTPADFNNNYGIFVRREIAEEQNLATLQDLSAASPELTFATFSEFQDRDDGFPNMQENYPDFDFEDVVTVNDLGLRYQGVQQGDADVGVGFLTEGQLTSDELTVMEDELSIWPFYYPAPVVRSDVLEEHPELEGILNTVSATLDVDTIRELNGRVDIEQEAPEDVAREHLEASGLV